MTLDKMKNTTA